MPLTDGPVFYDYFYGQNQAIANGSTNGYELNFNTLGVSHDRRRYETI